MRSRITLAAVALATAAGTLTAVPKSAGWDDQWFNAKFGRPSPAEEARRAMEQQNTALREEPKPEAVQSAPNRTEQYFQAKFGRRSPGEEARSTAEQRNTAFREEPAGEAAVRSPSWTGQYLKAKLGRTLGVENTGHESSR